MWKHYTDTVYINQNYFYRDTIFAFDTVFIKGRDTTTTIINNTVTKKNDGINERNRKWSVFAAVGITEHDIKHDDYTEPYYKFSPSVHGGITYNFSKRGRVSIVGDYTYPAQFLYNSQYIGIGGLCEYDFIRNSRSHLNLGTGLDYSHSYNKRTFRDSNTSQSNSLILRTDNLYIPLKLSYEYDFSKISIGLYARYRKNIKGEELSHNHFMDGGFQMRYSF